MLQDKLKHKTDFGLRFSQKTTIFKDLELDFEIRLKEVEEIFPPHLKKEKR
jgi:septum formation protein